MALTKAQLVDMNANELILDLDADTSLHASTDDQIDIKIGGADDFTFTANTFTALAGSSIVTPTLTATAATITSGAINLAALDIDGATDIGAAVVDADLFIIDDGAGGTNRKVTAARVKTYMGAEGGAFSVDNLDIDGSTDIGAAIVDADLFIIDDGAGGTNRKTAASRLKTYIGGDAGGFPLTALDIDGGTDIGADLVDADLFIIDDGAGGTNRKVAMSRVKTYIGSSTAADDLTIGDAAILLTTSSGNITIDAAANDSDIIFKGTDGSADTTFLTIDGSAAGSATFNHDVILPNNGILQLGDAGENIVGDGTNLTITSSADVIVKLGGDQLILHDGTSNISQFDLTSNHLSIDVLSNEKDMFFKGFDGGSQITALTLDMSEAGAATFNSTVTTTGLIIGSTAVTSTAAELNILDDATVTTAELNLIDGGTARGTTAVATGDGILINDGGTMRMTNVDTVSTYFAGHNVGGGNIVTTGALDSGSITSGFGAIDNGTSNIRSATITAETAFVPDAANGATLGTASLEFADMYLHDGGIVYFGADQDVELAHVADVGLTLKTATTSDDTKATLTLQTGDTDIAANDVLGQLHFQAPDEGAGTDAILVAAGIAAISEGDFSASNNATKLSFQTGASEAASEKMSLSSAGLLTIADDLIIGDGKTIGSASDPDAITIASGGGVTFTQTPVFPDGSLALADLDIDGGTDIGAAIVDADLFIVDDGAGGTNRKVTASRIKTYAGSPAGTFACSARRSSDLSLAGTTQVEVVLNQAAIDPDSKFNTSNGRYTPGVAGDYFVSYSTTISHAAADLGHTELVYFKIRMNGTGTEFGQSGPSGADHNGNYLHAGSAIIQIGDSDDYISLWHYNANGNGSTLLAQQATMNIFRLT